MVLDLDNTLWGGVIGEDALGSIRVGPPTAEGEGYLELQKYVKELQQRRVLLAVCSKNNLADAELPFRAHDAMHLRLEDFAAFVANWQDKATNLEVIAGDLSLGLDSFVFLDDNPLERALVRARLPQVVVPECGKTPWGMLAALRRGLHFETLTLTPEDRDRHASYRSTSARKSLEMSSASLDDLLRLEMGAEHGPIDEQTLPRVTQLINKTNQFNLTSRRYTEAQVRSLTQSSNWWGRWFRLADRFGNHGLVGVMLARIEERRWIIDNWLMSCRVLGRKLEDFMLCVLLSAAQERDAIEVLGEYAPTEKNRLVRDLYPKLGFTPVAEDSYHYVLNVAGQPARSCEFMRLITRGGPGEGQAAA
ncbi:MAG: HAD-IIIC family phosphatase [Planctomycetota bacterium]|nr:HAD-IIIC family phosphatase [Planctomycetota bacterium]